jgi:hypothetical protein
MKFVYRRIVRSREVQTERSNRDLTERSWGPFVFVVRADGVLWVSSSSLYVDTWLTLFRHINLTYIDYAAIRPGA